VAADCVWSDLFLLRKKKTLALAGMLLAIGGNSVGRLKRKS